MRYITPELLIKHRISDQLYPHWSAAIVCFLGYENSQTIVRKFNAKPIGYKIFYGLDEFSECPSVYEATIGSEYIGIITRCVWGGPQAAILVEELAYLGVQYLIGCGAAGSLDPSLPKGQQIVACSAIPVDGTSQSYSRELLLPEPKLADAVLKVGRNLQVDVHQVTVATIDALYRETESFITKLRSQGIQTINMETAPFYAASTVCGVKTIWIGHVSDSLTNTWNSWFTNQYEGRRSSAEVCLELLRFLFQC